MLRRTFSIKEKEKMQKVRFRKDRAGCLAFKHLTSKVAQGRKQPLGERFPVPQSLFPELFMENGQL